MFAPFKTKRITKTHRGVHYWKWPNQTSWLFPRGRGTEKAVKEYIDSLSAADLAKVSASSVSMIAHLDGRGEELTA